MSLNPLNLVPLLLLLVLNLPWTQVQAELVSTSLWIKEEIISPSGVPKVGYTINGTMPGPTIFASIGDTLRVEVHNHLTSSAITLHWHGINQIDSYFMDGAAMVTQCPIPPGSSFVYQFLLDESGTFWYHSHLGVQYGDGLLGALVVRGPLEEENYGYVSEHVLLTQDWFHVTGETIDLLSQSGTLPRGTMDSALINGRGTYNCDGYSAPSFATPFACTSTTLESYEVFEIQEGEIIRFRIINGAAASAFQISVDQHRLIAIATDGMPFSQVEIDYITLYPGERYDVLVTANKTVGNYWIRSTPVGNTQGIVAKAILRYKGAAVEEPSSLSHSLVETLSVMGLTPRVPHTTLPKETQIVEVRGNGGSGVWTLNEIAFMHPSQPPFQNRSALETDNHVITLQGGKPTLLTLINLSQATHPFHMHGHNWWVLGMGSGSVVDPSGFRYDDAIRKDTLVLPGSSWAAVYFVTDNPGYWMLHCHIEWHMAAGMALFFEELSATTNEVPRPPEDFPTCLPFDYEPSLPAVPMVVNPSFQAALDSPLFLILVVIGALNTLLLSAVLWSLRTRLPYYPLPKSN